MVSLRRPATGLMYCVHGVFLVNLIGAIIVPEGSRSTRPIMQAVSEAAGRTPLQECRHTTFSFDILCGRLAFKQSSRGQAVQFDEWSFRNCSGRRK